MKPNAVVLAGCLALALPALSEEPRGDSPHGEASLEHMMLSAHAGRWSVKASFWRPGAEKPFEATLSAENRTILAGYFLQQDVSGEVQGRDFKGLGIYGFDLVSKKHTVYWSESNNSRPVYMTGESKDGGKTVEFACDSVEADGKKPCRLRLVWKLTSDDSSTLELYGGAEGKERRMELAFTRLKGPDHVALRRATKDKIMDLSVALRAYETDYARYPGTLEDLLKVGPKGIAYYEGNFKDAWGNALVYVENGSRKVKTPDMHNTLSFDLMSYGADGKPGGAGDDADLGNW